MTLITMAKAAFMNSDKRINETFVPTTRRPMALFYALTIAIPVMIMLTMALTPGVWDWLYGNGRTFAYPDAALEAAQRLGYNQVTTNLIERVPAAFIEPVLWMPLIYAGAPTIGAIITILLLGKSGAFRTFLGRFNPLRNGLSLATAFKYYAILIALVFATRFVLFIFGGVELIDWTSIISASSLYAFVVYALVNQGGLLEECGWRTFALPYLQDHMSTPLAASLLLGLLWALWHFPIGIAQWDQSLFAFVMEYGLFTAGAIAMSVLITFFFNTLGGSVWPAIIFHGLVNQTFDMKEALENAHEYPAFLNQPITSWALYLVLIVAAFLVLKLTGSRLGMPVEEHAV